MTRTRPVGESRCGLVRLVRSVSLNQAGPRTGRRLLPAMAQNYLADVTGKLLRFGGTKTAENYCDRRSHGGEAQARLAVKMVPERRRVYRDRDKLSTFEYACVATETFLLPSTPIMPLSKATRRSTSRATVHLETAAFGCLVSLWRIPALYSGNTDPKPTLDLLDRYVADIRTLCGVHTRIRLKPSLEHVHEGRR